MVDPIETVSGQRLYEEEEPFTLTIRTFFNPELGQGEWVACLESEGAVTFGYGKSREEALEKLARTMAELPRFCLDNPDEVPPQSWERLWYRSVVIAATSPELQEAYRRELEVQADTALKESEDEHREPS